MKIRIISTPQSHKFGGMLDTQGASFSSGLTMVNAGGTHGENPIGGVPMGIAQDGMPNLVEEGEVVWNDYVFSNRINVPKETMERLGIKGKDTMTFAEAVEKAQKSSAERPNDSIEKRGLEAILTGLMQKQEEIRQSKAEEEQFNEMEDMAAYAADGGPIHIAKNKKGTFTAAAKKHGMGVQEFASKVLANKDNYSPAMVKKANFARNASKWHHALGGYLFDNGGLSDSKKMFYHDYTPLLGEDTTFNPGGVPYMLNFFAPKTLTSLYPNNSMFKTSSNFGLGYAPLTADLSTNYSNTGITDTGNSSNISSVTGIGVTNGVSTERDPLPTSGWQTGLRYLPAIAPAISLGYSLFKKPDYGYADELDAAGNAYAEAIREGGKVTPKFIGDYLANNPFDRIFYANELGAQQAANRSAIMNAGNANRGATMAALLGSGYNDNVGLGKLFREGDEYNLAQRQKVAEFNRATNQYNSTLDMQAQEINANKNERLAAALLENKYKSSATKQAIDNQRDQNISLALTNLFNNLGGIGEDFVNRYDRNALINADIFGTLSQKPYGVSDTDWQDYVNAHKKVFNANGGKLNRKKKKGLTI